MKKDFIMPVVNLFVLCLVISGALAIGNAVTEPVISAAAAHRAQTARKEIIPHADAFVLLDVDNLPHTVTEVYATSNNTGYVFMVTTVGYGGDIKLVCGIDPDGYIIKSATLAQTETKGIATPVFDMEKEYIGKDKHLKGIDAVAGATITSKAYMNGIRDAIKAFEIIKGAQ